MLEVEAARRAFGARTALDGVSLTLRAGEIYALLGPNGAGKTSLVRAICGRLRLDAGRVTRAGALGLVPQEIALYPELSVKENLEILGALAGVSASALARAVDAALAFIDLRERAGSRVRELSGGMQRRVNLAAGILHEPPLLLLDEPTVGVDPASRERLHALLRELRGRGTAILLTTHDLAQAAELADRVGILVAGRIRAEGPPAALVREAFGGARELRVSLARDPDPAAREALAREGLEPAEDGRSWRGAASRGLEDLAAVGRRLADANVPVAEMRLREGDLRGVFFRVVGRELDA